jgi:hypothetical protein
VFVEDTAAFLTDFNVAARFTPPAGTWTFDSQTPSLDSISFTFDGSQTFDAAVIFDQPDVEVLGSRALSVQYEILYRTLDLPGLVTGTNITVNGHLYEVIDAKQIDDGVFSRAQLEV